MKHTVRFLVVCLFAWGIAAEALAQWATSSTTSWSSSEKAKTEDLHVGDILSIILPGEPSLNKDFQVDRLGQITLPEVGVVTISGLSLPKAEETIKSRLAVAFRDLDRLSIKLKDRRLLINVAGFVKQPGLVDLPGDASVQNAIAAAGGLSEGAQLDRLQLKHGNEVTTFDYKKYLETGDAKYLPRLQPLDTIFVPSSPATGNVYVNFDGKTLAQAGDASDDRSSIKIFGEVNTPASFSYRQGATIIDMILRAGGTTRYAATDQIRVITQGEPVLFNLQKYLDTGNLKNMPALTPGATIFVPKQVEEIRVGARTVYVMGEVAKPGAFETQPNASFIEILANAGGPTRFADTRNIKVIKSNGAVEVVDLVAFTENPTRKLPEIKAGDAIFVPEKTGITESSWLKIGPNKAIEIIGAVLKPGRYEWSDEMSLFDLLGNAGGPTSRGDLSRIQILERTDGTATPIVFDAKRFIASGGRSSELPRLHAGSVVAVPELPNDYNDNKTQWVKLPVEESIYVMGEVGRPGRYAFSKKLSFLDILTAADGPTPKADITNIRVSLRRRGTTTVERVNLQRYFLTGDESILPRLNTGDVIFVPDQSSDFLESPRRDLVYVLGAVAKPGRYQFSDYMTILDLIAAAGGTTATGLQHRILIVNMSGIDRKATYFNLPKFMKTADTQLLPVIRPGDVVYVPEDSQDDVAAAGNFMRHMSDIASLYSLLSTSLNTTTTVTNK